MGTVSGWQTEIMNLSSPLQIEPPGIIGLLILGQQ